MQNWQAADEEPTRRQAFSVPWDNNVKNKKWLGEEGCLLTRAQEWGWQAHQGPRKDGTDNTTVVMDTRM
jgi:hypothetical protein